MVNVQVGEKSPDTNVIYVGSFDNIRFSGPETLAPGETRVAIYTSTNDFFGFRGIVVSRTSGKVVLTWLGGGTLEYAATLDGAWTEISNTSPATLDVTTGQRFFRLHQ